MLEKPSYSEQQKVFLNKLIFFKTNLIFSLFNIYTIFLLLRNFCIKTQS